VIQGEKRTRQVDKPRWKVLYKRQFVCRGDI